MNDNDRLPWREPIPGGRSVFVKALVCTALIFIAGAALGIWLQRLRRLR
jgi:hypothetical protein